MREIKCDACGAWVEVERDQERVRCPDCGERLRVPDARKGGERRDRDEEPPRRRGKSGGVSVLSIVLWVLCGLSAVASSVVVAVIAATKKADPWIGINLFATLVAALVASRVTYHVETGDWSFFANPRMFGNVFLNFFRYPQLGLMVVFAIVSTALGLALMR
jgi:DNA-directed RNA polymerase subunit RPC12/RpoP